MNRQKRRTEQVGGRGGRTDWRRQALELRQQGSLAEAAMCFRRALRQSPDDAEIHNNLGVTLQQQGLLDAAIAAYRQAIEIRPGFAGAYDNLGVALNAQGEHEAAVAAHRQAIALAPNLATAHNHLGLALKGRGASRAALACYQRALELQPNFADALNNLGLVRQEQGELTGAIACFRQAIAQQPQHAAAHANLGVALQEIGALDASFAEFEIATVLAPRYGAFHRMLAETGRLPADSPAQRHLEALAVDVTLPEAERLEVHFALAHLYASQSDPQRALPHLLEGNRLKRQRIHYDETASLARFEQIRAGFTAERLANPAGPDTRRPIFVVGMPRAGTSLVEQILASHPLVYGAGELPTLPNLVAAGAIAQLGRDYLAAQPKQASTFAHFVDKQPENFLHIGLIRMALPGARIIHVMRDPIDTCLSCFARLFKAGVPWCYDLGELGRYFRAYQALMAHWRAILPPGAMLEIRYEDIVSDLQGQTRCLLNFCDLPWHDACLSFHQTARPVRTASATQVRQPVYTTAIGRWEGIKEPMQQLLGL